MLSSPAHRATTAFLRGGLLAIVTLLATPRIGALLQRGDLPAQATGFFVMMLPVLGFAAAGAFGAAALGRGGAAVRAFAFGFMVTGLAMSLVWPQLAGLTGREPLLAVLLFSPLTWAAAFGTGGGLAAWLIDRRAAPSIAFWFGLGGAVGGLIFVAPSLLAPLGFTDWPPLARLSVSTLTSVAGLLTPFGVGGASAGLSLGSDGE